nr:immunoglobulin-like domain-containing protein [Clostridium ganghwense]
MDKEAGNSVQGLACNFDLNFVCSYETGGSGHHSSSRSRSSSTTVINEKPQITLLGSKTVNIKVGESYSDAGAEAYDKEDGNITDKIEVKGNVDTNTVGEYIITYNVKDSAGNKADEVTRTVKVEEEIIVPEEPKIPEGTPDKKRPVITLNGDSKIVLNFGDEYEELGATAVDDVDGDITDKIKIKVNGKDDEVNTNIPGNYVITYNVSDTAGNKAYEVTRIVMVKEVAKASDDEITVPEDKVPQGTPVLPKTGEQSPFIYYLLGAFMIISGVIIKKKDIKSYNE